VVDGAELEQAGCAGAVETTRLGWTCGARRSATPPLPGAPDPTAVPRLRERGELPGRGAHRRIDGDDGEEEEE
jgi:hypothetical protein